MEKRVPRKTVPRKAAAAEDVLGEDFSRQVPERWRKYYERLIEMRSFLRRGNQSQLRAANEQNLNFSEHMADAGTNSYEMDLALSRVSSGQDTLFEIDAALDRIQDGTYGVCESTGNPIDPKRLEAIPWTRFAAEVERELEKKGEIRRAKLPQPQTVGRNGTGNRVGEEWDNETESDQEKSQNQKS